MTFTQSKIAFLSQGSRFSIRAFVINAKRRKELIKAGVDKDEVTKMKCVNSKIFILNKREYKEIVFGGTKIRNVMGIKCWLPKMKRGIYPLFYSNL